MSLCRRDRPRDPRLSPGRGPGLGFPCLCPTFESGIRRFFSRFSRSRADLFRRPAGPHSRSEAPDGGRGASRATMRPGCQPKSRADLAEARTGGNSESGSTPMPRRAAGASESGISESPGGGLSGGGRIGRMCSEQTQKSPIHVPPIPDFKLAGKRGGNPPPPAGRFPGSFPTRPESGIGKSPGPVSGIRIRMNSAGKRETGPRLAANREIGDTLRV